MDSGEGRRYADVCVCVSVCEGACVGMRVGVRSGNTSNIISVKSMVEQISR